MKGTDQSQEARIAGIVGVGLDNTDGEQRITRSEHFVLLGGSAETHERMQDTAIYFNEALKKQGKPLSETPVDKVIDLLRESMDH